MDWNGKMPVNFVRFEGVVKRNAEAKELRKGLSVMDFTLVVPSLDGGQGVYVDCEAYGDAVETIGGYVEEGETIGFVGRMGYRTWTDGRGVKRSGTIAIVDRFDTELEAFNEEYEED